MHISYETHYSRISQLMGLRADKVDSLAIAYALADYRLRTAWAKLSMYKKWSTKFPYENVDCRRAISISETKISTQAIFIVWTVKKQNTTYKHMNVCLHNCRHLKVLSLLNFFVMKSNYRKKLENSWTCPKFIAHNFPIYSKVLFCDKLMLEKALYFAFNIVLELMKNLQIY